MRGGGFKPRRLAVALVVGLMACSGLLADLLVGKPKAHPLAFLPGAGALNIAIMTRLGPAVADVLWLKADEYWSSGKWYRVWPVLRMINMLNPHWVDAYRFTGWHAAYNLYAQWEIEKNNAERKLKEALERRKKAKKENLREIDREIAALKLRIREAEKGMQSWLDEGLSVLREGVTKNPDSWEMKFELGWTYFDKVQDYSRAARWLEQAMELATSQYIKGKLKTEEFGGYPVFLDHLVAHAYERMPDIKRALRWWYVAKSKVEQGWNKNMSVDFVAIGAITTIRAWYLRAWKLYEAGKYREALKALLEDKLVGKDPKKYKDTLYRLITKREWDWRVPEPSDLIGLHFLAKIYEAMGELKKARDAWGWCKKFNTHDRYAERMMRYIEQKMREKGMKVPKGLPEWPPWEEKPPFKLPEEEKSSPQT